MGVVRRLCRLHDGISDAGYVIGTVALAAMAAIYCYEVVTRYFLGIATSWGNDLFVNIMLISIFAMVPHATRKGQHIAITLLADTVPVLRSPLKITVGAVGVGVCFFMAWMSFSENLRHVALGIATEQNWPLPKILMSSWITFGFVGAAFYFLRAIVPGPDVRPVSWITPGRDLSNAGSAT
jgi:TRAP-type C4-dicarboxylate transport system permease small subunit